MSNVVPLVRPEAVDAAWLEYQAHVARSIEDRFLLTDRVYMERWARLERDWKRLFWAGEGH